MAGAISAWRQPLLVPSRLRLKERIPGCMQDHPAYAAVVEEVYDFLRSRLEAAVADGIEVERIAVAPGFGFGKTLDHNVALLGGLPALRGLDRPIVIGPSRKSFVGAMLRRPVEEREWGTAAAVAVGVFQGAHVVRVHSVRQMKDVAGVAQSLRDQMPVNRYSLNVKREALEGDDRCISSLHD